MAARREPRGNRAPALVVTGPTASGKSGLALAIAETFGGAVINADSMQVYRELAVLTARPGPAELTRAPHRLYGTFSGREPCSAGRWRALAVREIEACHAAGTLPVLAGGTGLYLRALESGLSAVPATPPEIRVAAAALRRKLGAQAFHAALAERDPAMAARLRPSDTQRLLRAWEVLEATGRSLLDWQRGGSGEEPAEYRFLRLVLLPPRAELYAACDARFLRMLEQGALEEVRALLDLGLDRALPVMKALGVPQLARHLAGEIGLEAAVREAQQATRNYAKRQVTWLRGQPSAAETVVFDEQYSETLQPKIFSIIRQFLLTIPASTD